MSKRIETNPMSFVEKRRWVEEMTHLDGMTSAMALANVVIIMNFHNGSVGQCFPNQRTVANTCNLSIDTVQRAVALARKRGFWKTEPRRNDRNGANAGLYYSPIFPPPVALSTITPTPLASGRPKPLASGSPARWPAGCLPLVSGSNNEKKKEKENGNLETGRPAGPAGIEKPSGEGKDSASAFDLPTEDSPAPVDYHDAGGQPPPAMRGMPVRLVAANPAERIQGVDLTSRLASRLGLHAVDENEELERKLSAMVA